MFFFLGGAVCDHPFLTQVYVGKLFWQRIFLYGFKIDLQLTESPVIIKDRVTSFYTVCFLAQSKLSQVGLSSWRQATDFANSDMSFILETLDDTEIRFSVKTLD